MKKLGKGSLLAQLRDFGIGPIVGMCISLITVPITTRILAPTEYAKTSMYSLCQTIFYLICLLGFDQSFVRFYNEDKTNKTSLFINCALFPVLFCLSTMIVVGFFWKPVSFFLFGQEELFIILCIIVSLPFSVIARFSDLKIRMDMRGKTFSFLSVFQQILNFILLILFLLFYEKSFRAIIISSFISTIVYCSLSLLLSRIFVEHETISISWDSITQFFKYGFPLVFASVLTWVMNSFDKVAIRTWSSFEELGLYSASFKIVSLVAIIQNIFTTVWTPVAYKWYEDKETKDRFFTVSNAMLGIMLVIFSLIIVFRKILLLYLGPEYRNTAEIFVFLLFSPIMYTVCTTTSLGIEFKKKSIYATIITIIVAVINLCGNYYFVPKYGALGASITTAVSYLVFLWLRTIVSNKLWEKYSLNKIFIMSIIMILFGINMITKKSIVIEILLLCFSFTFSIIINRNLIKTVFSKGEK